MPVLEATDKLAPKSVLRHRPLGSNQGKGSKKAGGGARPETTTTPIIQRASRLRPQPEPVEPMTRAEGRDEAEINEWQRIEAPEAAQGPTSGPTTATRKALTGTHSLPPLVQAPTVANAPKKTTSGGKTTVQAPRATAQMPRVSPPTPEAPSRPPKGARFRAHPLIYLGVGMLLMLALWTGLSMLLTWGQTTLDDLRYGRPRTFQTDAFVGHNESAGIPSHFIAVNLNRHIEVIELSGGDAAHTHIYGGPQLYGPNDDLTPVTLTFRDVNGDHKPDMILHFQDSQIIFINDKGTFRPLQPAERPTVEHFLQQHP